MATNGAVPDIFKVTRGFVGVVENAKVNIAKLYLRQITGANQSVVIPGDSQTGLGATGVSNWAIYDGPGSKARPVAKGQGMFTHAGSWNQWFTIVFDDNVQRFERSSLQVMGANDNDDEEESEWAIVGGTGEFAMARGVIKRRQYSDNRGILKQELYDIEFFCHMKAVPAPTKRGPWGGNGQGSLWEMKGKSQRLESVIIYTGAAVHGFQFSYIDEDEQMRTSGIWGRTTDNKTEIKFGPTEFVMKINGAARLQDWPDYLTNFEIVTNHKTYGPFGVYSNSGNAFSYPVPEGETVVGFFATTVDTASNVGIRKIGVYTI